MYLYLGQVLVSFVPGRPTLGANAHATQIALDLKAWITMGQLCSQILCGMYGRDSAGAIADLWAEPAGLKSHTGLTPSLAKKFITKSHKVINEFVKSNIYIRHMGNVGEWSQRDLDRLVLPTVDKLDNLEEDVLQEEVDDEGEDEDI